MGRVGVWYVLSRWVVVREGWEGCECGFLSSMGVSMGVSMGCLWVSMESLESTMDVYYGCLPCLWLSPCG